MPQPFSVHIPDAVLSDLKQRLAATRWPEAAEDSAGWKRGTSKAWLQEICRYWQEEFDWRAQEARINSFAHYRADIDGTGIHFLHEKGKGRASVPLLLIHGWPDSFVRFLDIIPLLTAADAQGRSFDVIVPSIPGYGFSDIPREKGMDPKRIAGLFAQLMREELGYKKCIAHGGDWGSVIAEQLGLYHAAQLLGLHLTDVPLQHGAAPVDDPTAAEKAYLASLKALMLQEGGYLHEQSTKPLTLGYAMNDSPAGLAAWILEKFHAAVDHDGRLEDALSREALLTNLTVYWATQTAASSFSLYYEAAHAAAQALNLVSALNPFDRTGARPGVPAGFALFPKDISHAPQEFAARFFHVRRWTRMSAGGHFTAMEAPGPLAEELRTFAFETLAEDRGE